ncbi:MAG TPA: hypothetical protein VIK14_06730 [Ignavibacteria bacterium]
MKLVILGAGASYDSVYQQYDETLTSKWKPPLGNDIFSIRRNFNDVLKKYPGAIALRSEIMAYPDIESYFQNKWDFIQNNFDVLSLMRLINIQYYLSDLFTQISVNYSSSGLSNIDVMITMAHEYAVRKKEDVIFITFNYDTLIESAFQRVLSKSILKIDDYIKGNIKLYKCHGSCNWFKTFNGNRIGYHKDISSKPIYQHIWEHRFHLWDINSSLGSNIELYENDLDFVAEDSKSGDTYRLALFPQLLIPMRTKDEFVLPENHKNSLGKSLNDVTDILIIGWKGTETHFNKFLSDRLSNRRVAITVVNAGDKSIEKQLMSFNINASYNYYNNMKATQNKQPGSFSQYIDDIYNNEFEDFFRQ